MIRSEHAFTVGEAHQQKHPYSVILVNGVTTLEMVVDNGASKHLRLKKRQVAISREGEGNNPGFWGKQTDSVSGQN